MRNVFACLSILLCLSGPVLASEQAPRTERLDNLFSDLKRTANAAAARRIAGRISAIFAESDSATVDLLMERAAKGIEDKKYDLALDMLDQVIMLDPAYAEGWNRRATVNFLMKNYAKAMADIERVLELEPRHFGAMVGLAAILRAENKDEGALGVYERALEVYPMMREAQEAVGKLADKLAGEPI